MRHVPSFALVGLLAVGCSGLFSGMPYATGAQTIFSQDQTCPPERVTVTERPDVPAHQILGGATDEKPPAAVAADPGRLRMWNDQHAGNAAFSEFVDATMTAGMASSTKLHDWLTAHRP